MKLATNIRSKMELKQFKILFKVKVEEARNSCQKLSLPTRKFLERRRVQRSGSGDHDRRSRSRDARGIEKRHARRFRRSSVSRASRRKAIRKGGTGREENLLWRTGVASLPTPVSLPWHFQDFLLLRGFTDPGVFSVATISGRSWLSRHFPRQIPPRDENLPFLFKCQKLPPQPRLSFGFFAWIGDRLLRWISERSQILYGILDSSVSEIRTSWKIKHTGFIREFSVVQVYDFLLFCGNRYFNGYYSRLGILIGLEKIATNQVCLLSYNLMFLCFIKRLFETDRINFLDILLLILCSYIVRETGSVYVHPRNRKNLLPFKMEGTNYRRLAQKLFLRERRKAQRILIMRSC